MCLPFPLTVRKFSLNFDSTLAILKDCLCLWVFHNVDPIFLFLLCAYLMPKCLFYTLHVYVCVYLDMCVYVYAH